MRYTLLLVGFCLLAACDSQGSLTGTTETALAAPADADGTTTRPIAEFLAANSVGCNFSWRERSDRPSNGRFLFIDYAGLRRNQVLTQSGGTVDLPTVFSGHITERALRDGSAELHVTLHARNALAWSRDPAPGFAFLFGYNQFQVAGGAVPSLVDASLTVVYNNAAGPGAPIQNICAIPGTYRLQLRVEGAVSLRSGFDGAADGDPGRVSSNQNGVVSQGQGNGVADGYPVEFVNIRATGG